jgi:deoxyribodipyrimidine photolyase-related protein
MSAVSLVFPHQLFLNHPSLHKDRPVYLIEEPLFFRQYAFHKRKLAFHRASMKFYETHLKKQGYQVNYIDSNDSNSDIRRLLPFLHQQGVNTIHYADVTDNWLEKRITKKCKELSMLQQVYTSPMFLNTGEELQEYFSRQKRMFQTDFYIHQRKQRNILITADKKPVGSRWTFDDENRLKYPKGEVPPRVEFPSSDTYYQEAIQYVSKHFSNNPGELNEQFLYPCTFEAGEEWLTQFLKTRFAAFGPYEDALVAAEHFLHHSVLTPMLNAGLLTTDEILKTTLAFAEEHDIPINSLEGFVRQLIGWREFIRAVYLLKGTEERTRNYWNFTRKIPSSFYTGTTGILPVDITIQKVLKTGYAHHIERLMVLGNFMLLCEFHPDEVYRWFMELFIDAYDWVMVPNVYGMSQFADGGLMATKPYISGSNYLMKMSNYPKGNWQTTWDALFWRFMHVHRDFFMQNPRMGMLLKTFDKLPEQQRTARLEYAQNYLYTLDKQR